MISLKDNNIFSIIWIKLCINASWFFYYFIITSSFLPREIKILGYQPFYKCIFNFDKCIMLCKLSIYQTYLSKTISQWYFWMYQEEKSHSGNVNYSKTFPKFPKSKICYWLTIFQKQNSHYLPSWNIKTLRKHV